MPNPSPPHDRALAGDLALAGVCVVALGLVLWRAFAPAEPQPVSDQPPIGQVEERHNDVRRRAGGHLAWEELPFGAKVHTDDAVYAAEGSAAVIHLDDGARIELDERSLVVLRQRRGADGERPLVALELVRGGARGVAGKAALTIVSGGKEVAVQGDARVRRFGDEQVTVDVTHGGALLTLADGRPLELRSGQRAVGTDGRDPLVTELSVALVAPEDGARVRFTGQSQVQFAWTPPAGKKCTLQVASGGDFMDHPLSVARLAAGAHTALGLAPGVYRWRVMCFDGVSLEQSAERVFTLAEDRAPVPFVPRDGETIDLSHATDLAMSWSELPDEAGYQLQLFAQGGEATPLVSTRVGRPSARVKFSLPEGRYCYRVRADLREQAPWSQTTCFRAITRPILQAPKVFEPQREELPAPPTPGKGAWLLHQVDQLVELIVPSAYAAPGPKSALTLRWEPVPNAVGYVLEIAEDREFHQVVFREKVGEVYYRWATVARRDYYYRVRGVDEQGREGANSDPVWFGSEVNPPKLAGPAAGARLELGSAEEPGWLRWAGSKALASYRVQLASDPAFTKDVETLEVQEPKASIGARFGKRYWRVTGIDLDGIPTEPSELREVLVVPRAPALVSPRADEALIATAAPQPVALSWAARPVRRYEVEVTAPGSDAPQRLNATGPAFDLPARTAGAYHWRVRGMEPESAWSAPASFLVKLAAPVPTEPAEGAELDGATAPTLRWAAVPLAEGYQVTLSAADTVGVTVPVSEARYSPGPLDPRTYRWTVRAICGPGCASEPSAVASFTVKPPALEVAVVVAKATAPVIEAPLPPPAPPATTGIAPPPPAGLSLMDRRPRLAVAAIAGVTTNLGALTAGSFALELSGRVASLPPPLRLALRAGSYSSAQRLRPAPTVGVDARLWAVPIELLAKWTVPLIPTALGTVDLVGAGGPLARYLYGSATLDDGRSFSRSTVEWGVVGRAAAELPVGPGRAYVEAGGTLSTTSVGLFVTTPVALSLGAGYRLEVW